MWCISAVHVSVLIITVGKTDHSILIQVELSLAQSAITVVVLTVTDLFMRNQTAEDLGVIVVTVLATKSC